MRSIARPCRSSRGCSSAARSSRRTSIRRTGSRSTPTSSSWEFEFFYKYFLRAYRGAAPSVDVQEALSAGMVGDRRGAGGRAARAVPSRLSQPQPDAARRRAVHHRFSGRAHGAGHLRPGVAAARLVRRPHLAAGRRADRVLPRLAAGAGGVTAGRTARVPPPLRRDGAAAQLQGARHVRLSDRRPAAIRSTSSTSRGRSTTSAPTSPNTRGSAGCRSCWPT